MNHLWQQYVQTLLDPIMANNTDKAPPGIDSKKDSICAKMVKADFSGAKIKIVNSKNPQMISQKGIIAKETKNAFIVITKKNE